jgi:hypothetical protein
VADSDLVPDEEAVAFEMRMAEAVTDGLGKALAPVLARSLAGWAAGQAGDVLRGVILAALKAARWPPMNPRIRNVATDAVELGVERASRGLNAPDRRKLRRQPPDPPAVDAPNLDALTRARVRQVEDLVGSLALDTKRDLDTVLGKVSAIRSRAEGQARWTANEGINAGTSGVARSIGRNLLWVPERDACLHCLAYAGWAVRPGETFPPSLTFADVPLERPDGIPYPPLHPGCRCQVKTYPGKPGPPATDPLSPSNALAREARRSVVYGWTAHASQAATLRAMSRLLEEGARLPASVERRARALVRKGQTQPRPIG